jgi:hypothetical protein
MLAKGNPEPFHFHNINAFYHGLRVPSSGRSENQKIATEKKGIVCSQKSITNSSI